MANIKGTAKWAKLGIPKDNYDEYNNNGNKNYVVNLYVTPEKLTEFKKELVEAYEAAKTDPKFFQKGKPVEFPSEPVLPVKTDADGKEFITLKTKAFVKDKETGEETQKTFPLFDKAGKVLDKSVGNNSKINVSYALDVYRIAKNNAGVVAYMNAILVEELVEFGGGTAAAFGFDVETPADDYGFKSDEEVPI